MKHWHWTKGEDQILRDLYPHCTNEEIMEKLPHRTRGAVQNRAHNLGTRKTAETRQRIRHEGVLKRADLWTESEDKILREHYIMASPERLMSLLPNRTLIALRARAEELEIRKQQLTKCELGLAEWEKAWLACALDTEGTIGLHSHNYADRPYSYSDPYVSFTNTDKRLVEFFRELIGGFNVASRKIGETRGKKKGHKPVFVFQTSKMSLIYTLLKEVRPYLVGKKRQAELLMEFIEIRNRKGLKGHADRQAKINEEVRELNRRGI